MGEINKFKATPPPPNSNINYGTSLNFSMLYSFLYTKKILLSECKIKFPMNRKGGVCGM